VAPVRVAAVQPSEAVALNTPSPLLAIRESSPGSCAGRISSSSVTIRRGQRLSVEIAHEQNGRLDFPVPTPITAAIKILSRSGASVRYQAVSPGTARLVAHHTQVAAALVSCLRGPRASVPTSWYSILVTARERLIDATAELLQRDGFSAMSPAAIQRRAGVGQGSMYHHFPGKAELARVALERNAGRLLAAADTSLGRSGSPIERVVAYLERDRDPLLGCPVGRLAQDREVVEDRSLRRPLCELFCALERRIGCILAEDREIEAPAELAAAVVAVLQGGYVLARAAGEREPFDRAISGAVRLLRTAYQGAEQ